MERRSMVEAGLFTVGETSFPTSQLEQYNEYRAARVLNVLGPPILAALGVTGNLMALFVLTCSPLRHSACCKYLASIACADTVILLLNLLFNFVDVFIHKLRVSDVACKAYYFVFFTCAHTSAWLLVAVTAQRSLVVRRPVTSYLASSSRCTTVVIGVVALAAVALNFQHLVVRESVWSNTTGRYVCHTRGESGKMFVSVIWPWVDATVYCFLPAVCLMVLNTALVRSLRRAASFRRKHQTRHHVRTCRDHNHPTRQHQVRQQQNERQSNDHEQQQRQQELPRDNCNEQHQNQDKQHQHFQRQHNEEQKREHKQQLNYRLNLERESLQGFQQLCGKCKGHHQNRNKQQEKEDQLNLDRELFQQFQQLCSICKDQHWERNIQQGSEKDQLALKRALRVSEPAGLLLFPVLQVKRPGTLNLNPSGCLPGPSVNPPTDPKCNRQVCQSPSSNQISRSVTATSFASDQDVPKKDTKPRTLTSNTMPENSGGENSEGFAKIFVSISSSDLLGCTFPQFLSPSKEMPSPKLEARAPGMQQKDVRSSNDPTGALVLQPQGLESMTSSYMPGEKSVSRRNSASTLLKLTPGLELKAQTDSESTMITPTSSRELLGSAESRNPGEGVSRFQVHGESQFVSVNSLVHEATGTVNSTSGCMRKRVYREAFSTRSERSAARARAMKRLEMQRQARQLTLMPLLASAVFVLCSVPIAVVLVVEQLAWDRTTPKQDAVYTLVRIVVNTLMYTNHAVNFLLYCFTGSTFRHHWCRLCCGIRTRSN